MTTAADGKNYKTKHYNLDMILSVGYRIKSHIATHFRQWATQRLREYIVKGFVLDDERLKNPDHPFDYFDELLRRIQDIRTSERRFYQKITDIYATSADYDPTDEASITFFKTVQNKMHWAITGMTAAEIIDDRVDASKPNMGLTSWRGEKVRKGDVVIAKNTHEIPYLDFTLGILWGCSYCLVGRCFLRYERLLYLYVIAIGIILSFVGLLESRYTLPSFQLSFTFCLIFSWPSCGVPLNEESR